MTSLSDKVARVKGSELGIERELELLRKIEDASLLVQQHRAVMEQALEALDGLEGDCIPLERRDAAMDALKQALGR